VNTYQDKRENIVVEPVQPIIEPVQPSTGFFHSLGERIGLVSPIPDESHFSKTPGLEQYPTLVTNNPTTINGAEHNDRLFEEKKPVSFTERAKDYVYGAGEWIGLVGKSDDKLKEETWHEAAEHAAFEKPVNEKAHDKLTEAGKNVGVIEKPAYEKAHDKLTEAGQRIGIFEKPAYEKAQDKLTEAGQKVGVVDKPAYEKAQDKMTEAGQKVGLVDKPAYEKAKDKFNDAKDTTYEAAQEARLGDQKSYTDRAKDYIYGVGERTGIVSSHPDLERAKDDLNVAKDKTYEAGRESGLVRTKSYPEIAAEKIREVGEKVGLVKTYPTEPLTEFQKSLFTDFTDMEGQKPPIMDVHMGEESIHKTLPA